MEVVADTRCNYLGRFGGERRVDRSEGPRERPTSWPTVGLGWVTTFGEDSVVLAVRVSRDLQPGMQSELFHDVANVTLYRVRGDVEAAGDLLVA